MTTETHMRVAPIKIFPSLYNGSFSEASIRHLVFNEHRNGFAKCVRRIGRKVLIDLDEFESWIAEKKD